MLCWYLYDYCAIYTVSHIEGYKLGLSHGLGKLQYIFVGVTYIIFLFKYFAMVSLDKVLYILVIDDCISGP